MKKLSILSVALGSMALMGCVDNNYDLSDIDTSARINVNNLVIPVNLEAVTLKSVLDLKETSKIKELEVAKDSFIYALVENGEFQSSKIKVPRFNTSSPDINPIKDQLNLNVTDAGTKMRGGAAENNERLAYYKLSDLSTKFSVQAKNIDAAVLSFDSAMVDASFAISLDVSELSNYLKGMHFENLQLQLIKGLTIGELIIQNKKVEQIHYDSSTGKLDLSELDLNIEDGHFSLKLQICGIDQQRSGIKFDATAHTLTFDSECKILSGDVSIYYKDLYDSSQTKLRAGSKATSIRDLLPAKVAFESDFDLSEINMKTFSGSFKYDINDIDINPVKLTDIPDILNQKGTDIKLKNPQIYLTINNPLSKEYDIEAVAGLKLTSNNDDVHRSFEPSSELTLDDETEHFLLSPQKDGALYGYGEWIEFEGLRNIVSGDGLPKSISIDVVNPHAPAQNVNGFELGKELDPVTGSYEFVVPIELVSGSQVLYSDSIDGWNDEDLDYLTVEKLGIDASVSSDIALDMLLTFYPLVIENGKVVKKTSGITTTTAKVPASAKGTDVTLSVVGKIEHLDGVIIEAKLLGANDSKVLAPKSSMKLNNLKVSVSGYYEKEL